MVLTHRWLKDGEAVKYAVEPKAASAGPSGCIVVLEPGAKWPERAFADMPHRFRVAGYYPELFVSFGRADNRADIAGDRGFIEITAPEFSPWKIIEREFGCVAREAFVR